MQYQEPQIHQYEKPVSDTRQKIAAALTGLGSGMAKNGRLTEGIAGLSDSLNRLITSDRERRQTALYNQARASGVANTLNNAMHNRDYEAGDFANIPVENIAGLITAMQNSAERNATGAAIHKMTGNDFGAMPLSLGTQALTATADNNKNSMTLRGIPSAATAGVVSAEDAYTPPESDALPMPQKPVAVTRSAPRSTVALTPIQQMAVKAIEQANKKYGTNVAPHDFLGMIDGESTWNPNAISATGNKGLGQLSDGLLRHYGVKDWRDPQANLNASAAYLAERYKAGGGRSINSALAGYFGGPNGQAAYARGGNPRDPNISTSGHIGKVARLAAKYKPAETTMPPVPATGGGAYSPSNPTNEGRGDIDRERLLESLRLMTKPSDRMTNVLQSGRSLNPYNTMETSADPTVLGKYIAQFATTQNANEDQRIAEQKLRDARDRADATEAYQQGLLRMMGIQAANTNRHNLATEAQPTTAGLLWSIWNGLSAQDKAKYGPLMLARGHGGDDNGLAAMIAALGGAGGGQPPIASPTSPSGSGSAKGAEKPKGDIWDLIKNGLNDLGFDGGGD